MGPMSPLVMALALVLGDDPLTPKSVDVDGATVRVRVGKVLKSGKKPKPHGRDDVVEALPLEGATPYVLPLKDETIVRAWTTGGLRSPSTLFRVTKKDGVVQRATLPLNDRAWAPVVCGKRWLVMAMETAGTIIFDLESNKLVDVMAQFGRFGNAITSGPACSPDGKYAAVPTPYGGRVTVVRLETATVAANIPIDAPASVEWAGATITIRPQRLPYE